MWHGELVSGWIVRQNGLGRMEKMEQGGAQIVPMLKALAVVMNVCLAQMMSGSWQISDNKWVNGPRAPTSQTEFNSCTRVTQEGGG